MCDENTNVVSRCRRGVWYIKLRNVGKIEQQDVVRTAILKSECIGVELSGVCGRVGDVRGMEECGWWEQGRMPFVEKRPLMVET